MKLITGLHHVTAITGDTQENIDFYTGVLGLRLVKTTVNFDYSDVYHFYFGDEFGTPGTIMTTFPYGKGLVNGRHGKGMLNTTAFSISMDALDYWMNRLNQFNIPFKQPQQRFSGEVFIYLEDFDGLGLELVFNDKDERTGYNNHFIPKDFAIKGIHHVEIWLDAYCGKFRQVQIRRGRCPGKICRSCMHPECFERTCRKRNGSSRCLRYTRCTNPA
jgi:glyoxalase family protein